VTTNYANRQVDVHCFYRDAAGRVTLRLALPGEGGQAITGILRLAQRFTMELLTERGSMRYLPERGTSLLSRIRSGFIQSPADFTLALSNAILEAATNLRQEEDENTPADERLISVDISEATLGGGRAVARLYLESAAGTARTLVLPVALPLRNAV